MKGTIQEENSFVSTDIYCGYSVPGAALGKGDTATNKTERLCSLADYILVGG